MPKGVQKHILLAQFTTFGIGGGAEFFFEATSVPGLREVIRWAKDKNMPVTILGGGSNVLIVDEGVKGLVVKIALMGTTYQHVDGVYTVTVGAGVMLDNFVEELVQKGIPGFENLSGIPGTVGATPIQNVGAYGVETQDNFVSVEVYDMHRDTIITLSRADCDFGYRTSVFKTARGRGLVILSVTFAFDVGARPRVEYKDLIDYFGADAHPTIKEIRTAILHIRGNKFPDWERIGTAGSFFKNPVISVEEFERLRTKYPELPGRTEPDGRVKIALGYVLDVILGLKGHREGCVGLSERQALVVVWHCKGENGHGSGATEIKNFAENITARVLAATGITIEWEVCVLQ